MYLLSTHSFYHILSDLLLPYPVTGALSSAQLSLSPILEPKKIIIIKKHFPPKSNPPASVVGGSMHRANSATSFPFLKLESLKSISFLDLLRHSIKIAVCRSPKMTFKHNRPPCSSLTLKAMFCFRKFSKVLLWISINFKPSDL